MNSAFAVVIDGEIEDIQNSPSIAILADESVDIAVYKKLDIYIYIRLVTDNEPCTRFVGIHNMPDGKAETINDALMNFMEEKYIDCGTQPLGLRSDGTAFMMGHDSGVGVRSQ